MTTALEVAALAVQLSREDAGLYKTARELAADAAAIVSAANKAKRAMQTKAPPLEHVKALEAAATRYSADLVLGGGRGMSVGLRFRSGRFANGSDNVYFVA